MCLSEYVLYSKKQAKCILCMFVANSQVTLQINDLWPVSASYRQCVCEQGRDSILSSAHSLPPSPAEPLYLPHLAHGANGNQPFSGEQKKRREIERENWRCMLCRCL